MREEIYRAKRTLELAAGEGRRVAVVSDGDPPRSSA